MPTVKTFAQVRTIVGASKINIKGETLKSLLLNLIKKHPEVKPLLVTNTDPIQIYGHWDIIINGQWIDEKNLSHIQLKDGDQVSIVPPIGGG